MPPVTLFVRSLKDGVGRQAPTKRLPTEAQDLVNTVITVERSAEKRPGTRHVPCKEDNGVLFTTTGDLELPASAEDMLHYWFDLTPQEVYLISIDFKGTGDLIYVHRMEHDGGDPVLQIVETVPGTAAMQSYVRYGNGTSTAAEALEIISIGPQLLILNKNVATGYTSTTTNKQKGLDGADTATDDPIGASAEYLSASAADPEGTAIVWVENRAYVGGQEVYKPSDGVGAPVYRALDVISSTDNTSAAYGGPLWEDTTRDIARVPVKSFQYPDSSKAYLGQSLNDIGAIKLPPKADDVYAFNGAEEMLAELYPDELGQGINGRTDADSAGKGKIYYFQNGYGGTEPGYYIVRSATESPYLMKIRTPENHSVIDADRMPVLLTPSNGGSDWSIEKGAYNERISGDEDSNPGPKAWDGGKQAPITAMATFRNRLWYSIGDTVFSSRLNGFGAFFLEDPALLVDTDPIDVQLSSNKYTPVVSLTPFESYIFVNTGADVQFALEGSDNQITPYTAALSSESFYSTSDVTTPLLMGNQVYFFDDKRMYIYMPSSAITVQRAMEVSKHCPNYLPTSFGSMAVCNAYETMFMTDDNSRSDVYCYTNRFQGDQLLQNAFFRMSYSKDVVSLHSHEEEIYMLTKDADNKYSVYIQKFREDDQQHIFLDNQERITAAEGTTTFYDESTNTTRLLFSNTTDSTNDLVIKGYENDPLDAGVIKTIVSITRDVAGETSVVITGRVIDGDVMYFGSNYEMRVDMSPIYQRDQQNNIIDGLLSLRSMVVAHSNTGEYFIEKTIRGRTSVPTTYTPMNLDLAVGLDPLPLENRDVRGESVAKIFGGAAQTELAIRSNTPNPVNITQIQIKGIFNEKYSSFNR